jgi:hypothetical protein
MKKIILLSAEKRNVRPHDHGYEEKYILSKDIKEKYLYGQERH